MTEQERNAYSNLILLCPTHHAIVDETPEKYPANVLEEWKEKHEQESDDTRELRPEVLEKLLAEVKPTQLVAHVKEEDLDLLNDVLDWEPAKKHPKDEHGQCPVVLTFEDLKDLLRRAAVPYNQKMNREPMYKQMPDWSEDEVIAALATATHLTEQSIQYYQVEGNRRESKFFNSNQKE